MSSIFFKIITFFIFIVYLFTFNFCKNIFWRYYTIIKHQKSIVCTKRQDFALKDNDLKKFLDYCNSLAIIKEGENIRNKLLILYFTNFEETNVLIFFIIIFLLVKNIISKILLMSINLSPNDQKSHLETNFKYSA